MTDEIQSRTTATVGDNSQTDRAHRLFNHVLALERLQEAKDEAGQDYNERKKILKSDGFDTNVTDAILKRRKNGSGQTQAFDELLAEYETQIQQAAINAAPKVELVTVTPETIDTEPQEPDDGPVTIDEPQGDEEGPVSTEPPDEKDPF